MEAFELARHLSDPLAPLNRDALEFKVNPRANFPLAEVASYKKTDQRWVMQVNFMGLVGHRGVLPDHYQESMANALRQKQQAYVDFLDVFQNRLVGLAYKSWLYCRPSLVVRQNKPLFFYTGLLLRRPASTSAIETILRDYFELPIDVIDFAGGLLSLSQHDKTYIGDTDKNNQLGLSMLMGEKVRFAQSACRLRIGPLTLAKFMQLLPGATLSDALAKMARMIVPSSLSISVELVLKKQSVPLMCLGKKRSALLGLNTWIKSEAFHHDVDDMHYALR